MLKFGKTLGQPIPVLKADEAVHVKKLDAEQQLVFGEVYAPGCPDSQGDFMTKETIQKMAYSFLKKGLMDNIDLSHTRDKSGCYIVESFIARDDDPTFIPGSWVLGVHVPDETTWNLVKSGELNGFSLDGFGFRTETVFEIDIEPILKGETEITDDHTHTFSVRYDAEGTFLGGRTSPGPNGHVHEITRGTATEKADGHSHRFSHVEGFAQRVSADAA